MPRPGEDRSDVGGAAQFNNIGPVPLSASIGPVRFLSDVPLSLPDIGLERVNQTDDAQELEGLRRSVQRGRPFGQPEWQKEIAKRLGLESAYRPTGRPPRVGRNQNASPG